MSTEIFVVSEFFSVVLAFVLVYFFFRAYKATRSVYLLGLPIGFSFLACSYVFLGASLLYGGDIVIPEEFIWLRLITRSYGFAFVGFTYFFSSRTEGTTKRFLSVISFVSAISLLFILGILMVPTPFLELPPATVVDECFTIANLLFLGYVIYSVVKRLKLARVPVSLLWAPTAFSLLWLGQYSSLIWEIDGSQTAFAFAHGARIASLVLLIWVYQSSGGAGH
jgi:hypothetical protein